MADRHRDERSGQAPGGGARASVGLSIGVVAARVGMHPQTLREYERKGLVVPRRTPGGTRRYREAELERLRRIQRLTEQGLSLAAVQYVLELEDTLRAMTERVTELERLLGGGATPQPPGAGSMLPARRSMSVEIVHVPRPRRGPRWRNID